MSQKNIVKLLWLCHILLGISSHTYHLTTELHVVEAPLLPLSYRSLTALLPLSYRSAVNT